MVYRRRGDVPLEIELCSGPTDRPLQGSLKIIAVADGAEMLYYTTLPDGFSVRTPPGAWLAVEAILGEVEQCMRDHLQIDIPDDPASADQLSRQLRIALRQFSPMATLSSLHCEQPAGSPLRLAAEIRFLNGEIRHISLQNGD
ncbi:MAG: hypothetical protein ABI538_12375 [Pseudoxanthomonas sp.]